MSCGSDVKSVPCCLMGKLGNRGVARHLGWPKDWGPSLACSGTVDGRSRARVAVVDGEGSKHALAMEAVVRSIHPCVEITWVAPMLDLPAALLRLEGVGALAVPIQVIDGNPGDLFTSWAVEALHRVRAGGILVFVAAGNRSPNALTSGGVSVAPRRDGQLEPPWWRQAKIRTGSRVGGTSSAAVRVATFSALFHRLERE